MSTRSIVLVGGPDTGKTNYVGRLWHALKTGESALRAAEIPADISFAEEAVAHLLEGRFAPRSELTESSRRDFTVSVETADGRAATRLIIPDISGELWRNAVLSSEIKAEWMEQLRRADGALLFVRVLSELNEQPLDWVTARELLSHFGEETAQTALPTQVMLCELVRFLEITLVDRPDGSRPRLAVIVTAWDLVDPDMTARGPEAYLSSEYPLFAGRLRDLARLDAQVYGLSVVGGDIGADADFRNEFLEKPFAENGWVAEKDERTGSWHQVSDVTVPVAWVIGT